MIKKNLLFELGTEELPPNTLKTLSNALLENIKKGLIDADLQFSDSKAFSTPRRLAVIVHDLSESQPDKVVEKRGPSIQAAFDVEGEPSKAAEGFARSCGTTVEKLERKKTDKGEWLLYKHEVKGQTIESLIPEIIRKSINQLPIAKKMRWGSFTAEFVRPVHWAILIYGDRLIKTKVLNVQTGSVTKGHRFHAPQEIKINNPEEYEEYLCNQGKVVADFEKRKEIIRKAALKSAEQVSGIPHIEEELLEEVAALNEWPVPVIGKFDLRFLDLPSEVLITTMQKNQKYFPVVDENNHLLPYFITISNIESNRPEAIEQGNERVIRPRLADAEFFWKQDRKKPLKDRAADLSKIVFQKQLGTLADKTYRLEQLAEFICNCLQIDSVSAKRSALLSKTDLLTEMVGEFPGLQGTMGRYYALADGESSDVALALEEQYFPKQSGSPTPTSACGQVLSIAEKTDMLTGIFSTGMLPTGDKDPYALRRSALGLLRTVIENKLDLNIIDLIDFGLRQLKNEFDYEKTRRLLIEFIYDRFKGYCIELGYTVDEFEAVNSVHPGNPLDFIQRLAAVKEFRQLPEAESLSSANKRIRNILKKTDVKPSGSISRLNEPEELQLWDAAKQSAVVISPLLEKRNYQAALNRLAQLRNDVDEFFDHVMVMTDDPELRADRLGLLAMLENQFLQIADISKLQ